MPPTLRFRRTAKELSTAGATATGRAGLTLRFRRTAKELIDEVMVDRADLEAAAARRVAAFERKLGQALPDDYRAHALELETVVEAFARAGSPSVSEYLEVIDFPVGWTFVPARSRGRATEPSAARPFLVCNLYSLHPRAAYSAPRFFGKEGKKAIVPYADNGVGDVVGLAVAGPHAGKMVRVNHELAEGERGRVEVACESFTEFLRRCRKRSSTEG